jgi:hypothetical protein
VEPIVQLRLIDDCDFVDLYFFVSRPVSLVCYLVLLPGPCTESKNEPRFHVHNQRMSHVFGNNKLSGSFRLYMMTVAS